MIVTMEEGTLFMLTDQSYKEERYSMNINLKRYSMKSIVSVLN